MALRFSNCLDCNAEISIEGRGRLPVRCDTCKAEVKRQHNRTYKAANLESVLQQQRDYKAAQREQVVAGQRDYYARNRDAILEQKQDYYLRNRDAVRERMARHRRENAARYCAYALARLARKRAVFVAPVDHAAIYERDGGICGICDEPVNAELRFPDPRSASIDHIIALANGGIHAPENVQLAHLGCNAAKGARAA